MGNEFTLLNVMPEPLVFNDRAGKKYDVLRPNQFGLRSLALIERLETRINEQRAELADLSELDAEDDENDAEYQKISQQLESLLTSFIRAVAPKLPAGVCQGMTLVEKFGFLNWWKNENAPKSIAPEMAAGTALVTKPIRKGSSRG